VEVIRDGDPCPHPSEGTVVTIGVYDGVHLGHRAVIAEVKLRAAELGACSAVVTFDRHPAAVVRPESAPLLLTDLDQRLARIKATGVDYTVVIRFDEARAAESAEDFVERELVECLNARGVVVGEDFHFGNRRAGNVALLQEMGTVHRFEVEPLGLVAPTGEREPVSSTAIRQALARGDLETATAMLGRHHEVWGVVMEGDRRGRQLGFPTANVAASPEIALPADGIYAGWYERPDGSVHPAALSLGRRPTFYPDQPYSLLEAYLLGFEGDLYGELAKVRFVARLRDELRFDSVDALVTQMRADVAAARAVLVT
jgi:riboflavin kinase / FMN adenylyltransferase